MQWLTLFFMMMGVYLIPGLQVKMDQISSGPTVMVISNLEDLKEAGFSALGEVEAKSIPAEKERTEYYRRGIDLARRHLLRQRPVRHRSVTELIEDLKVDGPSYSKGTIVFAAAAVCESQKETITLTNTGFKDIVITSVSLAENEPDFVQPHPMIDTWEGSFFLFPKKSGSYHILPPGGNLTVTIGFIPSTEIKSTSQLVVTSSLGQVRIPIEGHGVASRYNVTAISMGRTLPGVAVGIEIEVYNPHDEWLIVKNIESSQYYFQLAITHSGDPAPSTQFQIPPKKSSVIGYAVANIPKTGSFRGRIRIELITVPSLAIEDIEEEAEDEYLAGLRRNSSDSADVVTVATDKVSLYVPLFIQISATEVFAVPSQVDFGLLTILSETRLRPISVFNDGEGPVTVESVNLVSNNSLIMISYDSTVVVYPGQTVVVAEVTTTAYVQGIANEAVRIVFNDSSVIAVPVRIRTLFGKLSYPLSTTVFQNEDMGIHTLQHNRIPIMSSFAEPIRVLSVSIASRFMTSLLLDTNTLLQPFKQGCPVIVTVRVFPPTPAYSAVVSLVVNTNLTTFYIPITVHCGGLVVTNTTAQHREKHIIDAGPLPPESQKIHFSLANPTPWGISVVSAAVFYAVEGGDGDDFLFKVSNFSIEGMGEGDPIPANSVRRMTFLLPANMNRIPPKIYATGGDREIKIIFDTKRAGVSTTSRQLSLTIRYSIIAGEILWRLKGRDTEDWQRALEPQNKTSGGSDSEYFSVNCGTMKVITAQMQHSYSAPLRLVSVKSHSGSISIQFPSQRLLPHTAYDLIIDIRVTSVPGTEFGRTLQLTASDAEEQILLEQFHDNLMGDEIGTYVTASFVVEGLGSEVTRTFWVQANTTLHPFADDTTLELPPSPPGTETTNWIGVTNPLPFDVELELVEIPADWNEIMAAAEKKYSGNGKKSKGKKKRAPVQIGESSQWSRSLRQATRRITLPPGESSRLGPVVFQQHASSKNDSDSGHFVNSVAIRTPTGFEVVTIHARLGYRKLAVLDSKNKKNPRKKSQVNLKLSDKQLNAILDLTSSPVSPLDFLRYLLSTVGWPHPPPFNPPLPTLRAKYTLLLKNEGAIPVNIVGAGYKLGTLLTCSIGDLRVEGLYPCCNDSDFNTMLKPGENVTFRVIYEPTLLVQQSNATFAICSTELGRQMTVPHAVKGVWLPGSDCIAVELPVFGSLPDQLFPILMATAEASDSFVRSLCIFVLLVIGVLLMVDTIMDSVDELLRKEQPVSYQVTVESIRQQLSSTDAYISAQLAKQNHRDVEPHHSRDERGVEKPRAITKEKPKKLSKKQKGKASGPSSPSGSSGAEKKEEEAKASHEVPVSASKVTPDPPPEESPSSASCPSPEADNNDAERKVAAEREEELLRLRRELEALKEKDDALRLKSFGNEEAAARKAISHTENEERSELRIRFLTERPAVVEPTPVAPLPPPPSEYSLEVGALRDPAEPQREFNLFSSENPLFSHPQFVQQQGVEYDSVSDSEEPPPLQDDDRDDNNAITTLLNSFLTADQPSPGDGVPGGDPWSH
eukprot:TRINITY_DN16073_c0_g1_i2.p1 TRINITY_DN16073_c0_g1~~TRINITY_DN16073_c0_g1_i2.p1  ORF type:complete len:1546 (+),score=288.24 TRINITY_DN16073_c0_g1_i2:54-4691(+)